MMHGRPARRRRRARAARGFTLLELMVVVLLVAILAMIAAPSMSTARNDQIAFDYARQTSELFHNARARSAGRGSAHLVAFTTEGDVGKYGAVFVFEALDGTATPTGPNPSTSCRSETQWAWAATFKPGAGKIGQLVDTTRRARLVDFLNINATSAASVQRIEDMTMIGRRSVLPADPEAAATAPTTTPAFVVCTTPNGTTYAGTGATMKDAVTAMAASTTPFKDLLEVDVARHRGTDIVGLNRRVLLAGAAAPRIKSE